MAIGGRVDEAGAPCVDPYSRSAQRGCGIRVWTQSSPRRLLVSRGKPLVDPRSPRALKTTPAQPRKMRGGKGQAPVGDDLSDSVECGHAGVVVHVMDEIPVLATQLGLRVHEVAKQHSLLSSGIEHDDRRSRRMPTGLYRDDPGHYLFVALEEFESVGCGSESVTRGVLGGIGAGRLPKG